MDFSTILLLSVALAMDCFAVSMAKGTASRQLHWGNFLKMAFFFGVFQAGMPLIGYLVGFSFARQIEAYDHWIALAILTVLGAKMIWEDVQPAKSGGKDVEPDYGLPAVFLLSVATSIDALATGLLFVTYSHWLWIALLSIGLGSFILSLVGSLIGYSFGNRFRFRWNLIGGVILIGIGIKIVLEHCIFS